MADSSDRKFLPPIPLQGESFASRVGVSLLHNLDPSLQALVVASQREYEDLAVELLSTPCGRRILGELRARLEGDQITGPALSDGEAGRDVSSLGAPTSRTTAPLFDTEAITMDINRAFMLMSDLRDEGFGRSDATVGRQDHDRHRYPHIFMTQRRNTRAPVQDSTGAVG